MASNTWLAARNPASYIVPMITLAELKSLYYLPLPDLIWKAGEVFRAHHDPRDIQRCALFSVKTGGCPEDCAYCSQSARYQTNVEATPMLSVAEVAGKARQAKERG